MNSLQGAYILSFIALCCMASHAFYDYSMDEFDDFANVASTTSSQYCRFGKKSFVSLPAGTAYQPKCKNGQIPKVVHYYSDRSNRAFCEDKPLECSFGTFPAFLGGYYTTFAYCAVATKCSELQPGTYRTLNEKTCVPPCPSAFPVSCYEGNRVDVCATSEDACKRVRYGAFPECK